MVLPANPIRCRSGNRQAEPVAVDFLMQRLRCSSCKRVRVWHMVKSHPRNAVIYLIAVMTLMVLFPPWRFGRDYLGRHMTRRGPYAFIGSPPASPDLDYQPEIDPVRLFVPMSIWMAGSVGMIVWLERRRSASRRRDRRSAGG